MPRALELFYTRRPRTSRSSEPSASESAPPPLDRRNRRQWHRRGTNGQRGRLDPNSCDPLLRVPIPSSHPPQHRSPNQRHERELIWLELGGTQFFPGDANRLGNQNNDRDRERFSGDARLPGDVLLARERLLHRLSAVTLSNGRPNDRSSSSTHSVIGDIRLVDARNRETEISREWLTTIASSNYRNDQQISERPPGLTQDALNCLHVEVFHATEKDDEDDDTSSASRECSICLEQFLEEEELMSLPCGHRYHVWCLVPWVQSCGACPYCRQGIVANMDVESDSEVEPF